MNILALDTTSAHSSVAVLRDDSILLEYNFTSMDNLSSLLIPSLEFLLKSLRLHLEDIELFGVGIGPGLFTGIRIGLSTIKGLLFAEPRPVVPVVTLNALAHKFGDARRPVVPLIDARRGEVYTARYLFRDGRVTESVAPRLAPIAELNTIFPVDEEHLFVGSGAEAHREWLRSQFRKSKIYSRSFFLASEIGRIAYREVLEGRFITDLQKLQPLYIRKPDAEIHAAASH